MAKDDDIVQQHLEAATAYVSEQSALRFSRYMQSMVTGSKVTRALVESPLEMLFLVWWNAVQRVEGAYWDLWIEPQARVVAGGQHYRVDFLVVPLELKPAEVARWQPIAVEVDGHAFHERTREQVQIRDSRDRALTAAGWRVFHFSFSEFTANPVQCVNEVMSFAQAQIWSAQSVISEAPNAAG